MEGAKLTRTELLEAVWQRTSIDKRDIKDCYEEIIKVIKEALNQRMVIELRGFGTFEVHYRKGKKNAQNPRTHELVPSWPHGKCVFKPGRELKLSVWRLGADNPAASAEAEVPSKVVLPSALPAAAGGGVTGGNGGRANSLPC